VIRGCETASRLKTEGQYGLRISSPSIGRPESLLHL